MDSKIIVLTGVTRGLGRAMADEFARLGHTILGCGRSTKPITELRWALGPPNDFEALDVSNDQQVKHWAERLLARFSAPDLLVNNAGVINRNAPLWKIPPDEFSKVIDINIKGFANTIRHFLPAMLARKTGIIVNFSSGWGRSTDAEVAPYCATKWAIEGMTQALAQELPDGLAAVALNPGIIDTEMLRSCFGDSASSYPSPQEWAQRAVPFLLRLDSKDNGQALTLP